MELLTIIALSITLGHMLGLLALLLLLVVLPKGIVCLALSS